MPTTTDDVRWSRSFNDDEIYQTEATSRSPTQDGSRDRDGSADRPIRRPSRLLTDAAADNRSSITEPTVDSPLLRWAQSSANAYEFNHLLTHL